MATVLDKDVIRETSIKINEREIILTMGSDQTISMKLKGMKSGASSISIEDLYNQLNVNEIEEPIKKQGSLSIPTGGNKKQSLEPMISLHDIRHLLNVSNFDYAVSTKWDSIIKSLIEDTKK